MSLPASGEIRISQLQTVMGGGNPIYLSEYYQNASTSFTSGIAGIPNIGSTIRISNFYGKNKATLVATNSIYARYTAEGPFTKNASGYITQWNDLSGNNRHITSGYFRGNVLQSTFTQGTKGLLGTSIINTVRGNNTDGLYFPFALTQASYTFCYIARYRGDKNNTTYNRRIFDSRSGTGENTIWGFHDKVAGRSHNGNRGWVSTTEFKQSEPDWWIIGIDTEITARYNGMDFTNYYSFQGTQYPIRPIAGFNPTPTINFGTYTGQANSNETSDWEVIELIFYNRELTLSEQIQVETYFSSKYKHISFINNSPTLENFKTNCSSQITLYNLFYIIYNGFKWGYSLTNNLWYGPSIANSQLYIKNNRYYWLLNLQNWNLNDLNRKYSNGADRNQRNITYTIKMPNNTYNNYKTHCIINGGGGGGSSRGAGAGGQSYFYNSTGLYNLSLILTIGNRANSYAYYDANCSAGGDTSLSYSSSSLIGYGGYEGDNGSGGGYNISLTLNIFGTTGGQNGGSYSSYLGGAISTITNSVNLYPDTTLWAIINDSSIANVYSYNSGWWWDNVYGAGGMGYRGGISGDPYARRGGYGGPGFIILILDFN